MAVNYSALSLNTFSVNWIRHRKIRFNFAKKTFKTYFNMENLQDHETGEFIALFDDGRKKIHSRLKALSNRESLFSKIAIGLGNIFTS